jgi:hypothetical protein
MSGEKLSKTNLVDAKANDCKEQNLIREERPVNANTQNNKTNRKPRVRFQLKVTSNNASSGGAPAVGPCPQTPLPADDPTAPSQIDYSRIYVPPQGSKLCMFCTYRKKCPY